MAFYLPLPTSWHNTDKVVTACLYGRESQGAQGKQTLQAVIYFYFILLSLFLMFDNSFAYMFIHTAHAYAHILLHKIDGSKRNMLKGTVKGQYHTL